MGSRSSKRKDNENPENAKTEKKKTKKNKPSKGVSTQSLSIVESSPQNSNNPSDLQPDGTQSLQDYQDPGDDLPEQDPPGDKSSTNPHQALGQENRSSIPFQSQTSKDFPDRIIVHPTPPIKQTPLRRKPTPDTERVVSGFVKFRISKDEDDWSEERNTKNAYMESENKASDEHNIYHQSDWSSTPKVIANSNYGSTGDNDISFKKGDTLQRINDGEVDGRCYVRNITSNEEGYVPAHAVNTLDTADVKSQKFFFKGLDRADAEERLLDLEVKLGTYLLRPTAADASRHVLSLRCQNNMQKDEIRHYRLRVEENGTCYIEDDSYKKPFNNITALIKHYTEKPGLRCKLRTPLPQDVPLDDLVVKFSDLKLQGQILGSGNFGSVHAGTLHETKQVAVTLLRDDGSMTVRKEAETISKLRHRNLVSLIAVCVNGGQIYIITEWMSRGDLLKLLQEDKGNTISFKDLMAMAIQVLQGMCYLEKRGFGHRDLSAANVLVGDRNITKIANFGLLVYHAGRKSFCEYDNESNFRYKWTAPEAIKQLKLSSESNVWSFGILLYEMVTYGDEPYSNMRNDDVLSWVEKGKRLDRPTKHHCPLALYGVMKQCWLSNPAERPNFEEIKETLRETYG